MQEDIERAKRTKILYMITKGNAGGAQEYVYTLATSLPENEFETIVICGAGNELPQRLQKKGILTYSLPTLIRDISVKNEIKSFFALVKIIKKEKPDVLHLNSSKIGGLGALAGRLAGVPNIIFTAHGWASNEESRSYAARGIIFFLHWITVFLSHTTIAVSEKTKRDIATKFIDNKIKVIHNGIGKIEFLAREESRKFLHKEINTHLEPQIMIGTVCELHANKGLDVLIEASKRLPDNVGIYIIGTGEEKESLEKAIQKNKLESKIFLLGRIENAKQYLKAFDIFTLTSRNENLPYALLEAGQASLAVVASKVGGIPEIIENSQSGVLVTKNNPSEVARALEYLLENPDKRNLFGENLKQKVDRDFSVDGMVSKTIEIYRK